MGDWPSYFDTNLVRLDEFEGTLRTGVPPDRRMDGGCWALIRRFIPGRIDRDLDAEARLLGPTFYWEDGFNDRGEPIKVPRTNEEKFAASHSIGWRRATAYVHSWSYTGLDGKPLPVTPEAFDELPEDHADAILRAIVQLRRPVSDEDAKSLLGPGQGAVQVRGASRNGTAPVGVAGPVQPDEGLGAAGP